MNRIRGSSKDFRCSGCDLWSSRLKSRLVYWDRSKEVKVLLCFSCLRLMARLGIKYSFTLVKRFERFFSTEKK